MTTVHAGQGHCWTPWWSNEVCEQVPAELPHNQVTEVKKVELQKFAERGVCKVADRSAVKLKLESVMLSVMWVITDKGSAECPKPQDTPRCSRIFPRRN